MAYRSSISFIPDDDLQIKLKEYQSSLGTRRTMTSIVNEIIRLGFEAKESK